MSTPSRSGLAPLHLRRILMLAANLSLLAFAAGCDSGGNGLALDMAQDGQSTAEDTNATAEDTSTGADTGGEDDTGSDDATTAEDTGTGDDTTSEDTADAALCASGATCAMRGETRCTADGRELCVAVGGELCFVAEPCGNDAPVCDPTDGSCVGCASDAECGDLTCDTASGRCVECASDTDCTDVAAPLCNPDGICVGCVTSDDCTEAGAAFCDDATATCRGCAADAECGVCGMCDAGTCIDAAAGTDPNTDCPATTCDGAGACLECDDDTDCVDGFCNSSNACQTTLYAGMASEMTSGWTAAWTYGGNLGIQAGDDACAALGADHVCTYEDLLIAEANGEFAAIEDGTTIWVHRVNATVTVPETGVTSTPGAGGRCNDWTYPSNHVADGEWAQIDAGALRFAFDSDTTYSGDATDGHQGVGSNDIDALDGNGGPCGGVLRHVPCCYPR